MDLRSNLLSSLLENIDEDRRLTVLDIGPALPETVAFFSQFKCRLYFADLFSNEILGRQNEEISDDELRDSFARLLDYPERTKLDICLFWDALNYLDRTALGIFSEVLRPFLSTTTGIHGFSPLKASKKLPNQLFSIKQLNCLRVRHREGVQPTVYPHPQVELNRALHGIAVSKSTLLPNGLLEMLFKVTD